MVKSLGLGSSVMAHTCNPITHEAGTGLAIQRLCINYYSTDFRLEDWSGVFSNRHLRLPGEVKYEDWQALVWMGREMSLKEDLEELPQYMQEGSGDMQEGIKTDVSSSIS